MKLIPVLLALAVILGCDPGEMPVAPSPAPVVSEPSPEAPPAQPKKKTGGRCIRHKFKLFKPMFCPFCD